MASAALSRFNTRIDSVSITSARRTEVKAVGRALYVEGVKEGIFHLAKHAAAIRDDPVTSPEMRAFCVNLIALVGSAETRYNDAWWVDIPEMR